MFICGYNFVGGEYACALTPTDVNEITEVTLQNGIYDEWFITEDVSTDLTSDDIDTSWDFDTVLYAKFQGDTSAGNVTSMTTENTSHIILKSRLSGSFTWKTLTIQEISSEDDFSLDWNDYTVANSEIVEYALVPIQYGVEGDYLTATETSDFSNYFIIEKNLVYGTAITDGYCDTTRNIPSSNIELMNYRYPMFVRNSIANYDTGSCEGSFLPIDADSCSLDVYDKDYDLKRIKYQREVMDFLADGKPKILKVPDGRIWIVQVTPNPTDTSDLTYNDRVIGFSWVEIGDVNSESDLYYLGFSDVTSEWWSNISEE